MTTDEFIEKTKQVYGDRKWENPDVPKMKNK